MNLAELRAAAEKTIAAKGVEGFSTDPWREAYHLFLDLASPEVVLALLDVVDAAKALDTSFVLPTPYPRVMLDKASTDRLAAALAALGLPEETP